MKQTFLTALKFVVFLGLGILLIWLVVKDLSQKDIDEIFRSLSEANYFWIVLAMITGLLSHLSRALRWRMLMQPLGHTPKISTTFYAIIIGYLGNLAFLRLGEVLRCGILKRYEKIPLTQSFGTVIAERVIDMLSLMVLFLVTAWIEYARMHDYISENILAPMQNKIMGILGNTTQLVILLGGGTALVIALFLFRNKIMTNPLVQKIKTVILSFVDGIKTVGQVKSPLLFLFHTFFIWAMYILSVYVCVFAFAETKTLTFSDALAIMCFGSLGVIVTPGGIGVYQWIVLQIMLLWGYSTAIGVAFGWVVWLSQTVIILLVGLLSLTLLAINNKEDAPAS